MTIIMTTLSDSALALSFLEMMTSDLYCVVYRSLQLLIILPNHDFFTERIFAALKLLRVGHLLNFGMPVEMQVSRYGKRKEEP